MPYMDDIMAEWRAAKAREASDLASAQAARAKEQAALGLNSQGTVIVVAPAPVFNPPATASGSSSQNNAPVNTSGVPNTGTFNPVIVATGRIDPVIPTGQLHPEIKAITSALDDRKAYAANFTGWDNDPTLRSYQTRSMDIYITTGRWDTPEQIQLHNEAEALRKSINVTYGGSIWGTKDKAAADKLILPDSNPNATYLQGSVTGGIKSVLTGVTGANVGTALKLGGLAIGTMFILSIFKGGHR